MTRKERRLRKRGTEIPIYENPSGDGLPAKGKKRKNSREGKTKNPTVVPRVVEVEGDEAFIDFEPFTEEENRLGLGSAASDDNESDLELEEGENENQSFVFLNNNEETPPVIDLSASPEPEYHEEELEERESLHERDSATRSTRRAPPSYEDIRNPPKTESKKRKRSKKDVRFESNEKGDNDPFAFAYDDEVVSDSRSDGTPDPEADFRSWDPGFEESGNMNKDSENSTFHETGTKRAKTCSSFDDPRLFEMEQPLSEFELDPSSRYWPAPEGDYQPGSLKKNNRNINSYKSDSNDNLGKAQDKKNKNKIKNIFNNVPNIIVDSSFDVIQIDQLEYKKLNDLHVHLRQQLARHVIEDRELYFAPNVRRYFDFNIGGAGSNTDWRLLDLDDFFEILYEDLIGGPTGDEIFKSHSDKILETKLKLKNKKTAKSDLAKYVATVLDNYEKWRDRKGRTPTFASEDKQLAKRLITNNDGEEGSILRRLKEILQLKMIESVEEFLRVLQDEGKELIKIVGVNECLHNPWGVSFDKKDVKQKYDGAKSSTKFSKEGKYKKPFEKTKTFPKENTNPITSWCNGCGGKGHEYKDCRKKNHPHFNRNETMRWNQTQQAKRYLKRGMKFLPNSVITENGEEKPFDPEFKGKRNGNGNGNGGMDILLSILEKYSNDFTSICSIQAENQKTRKVRVLLDTGALSSDYISEQIADWLGNNNNFFTPCHTKVMSVINNMCSSCSVSTTLNLTFKSEITQRDETISFNAKVINSVFDIIIGRETITRCGLLDKMRSKFLSPSVLLEQKHALISDKEKLARPSVKPFDTDSAVAGTLLLIPDINTNNIHIIKDMKDRMDILGEIQENKMRIEQSPFPGDVKTSSFKHPTRGMLKTIPSSVYFSEAGESEKEEDPFENEDDIYELIKDDKSDPSFGEDIRTDDLLSSLTIQGTPELISNIKSLCFEYKDIFGKNLRPVPADVSPMKMEVDDKNWRIPRNTAGMRPMSESKRIELEKQITELLDKGVIRFSNSEYHSQALLVPKPDGSWRLCIDYRFLNSVTKKLGWPLPNIDVVLRRIGYQRPKYFGTMDLTKGYFQTELEETSKEYTAFITHMGKYEFNRVAMGLTGAPSYFQRQIATSVLEGLMGTICELYIDDIITYGRDEEEFMERLRKIFQRLREKKVILHPGKCKFGMDKVKYLGHEIDAEGFTISKDKIEKVIEFPKPVTQKQLKSFLGVVNYFHQFIPHHSTLVQPMQLLVRNYKKYENVKWTEEAEKSFEDIKSKVFNCPKICFPSGDPNDRIILTTDASDYGLGAYLCQIINDKEVPIGFISRAFSKQQARWSTIEKEAYAIYYSIKHWEHLLQDRCFLLQTDHRNLTYITTTISNKVLNWKLSIQEYKFEIVYLPGDQNKVADFMSRVPCRLELEQQTEVVGSLIDLHKRYKHNKGHDPIRLMTGDEEIVAALMDEYKYTEEQRKIISQFHNSVVGHFGIEKTIQHLKRSGHSWTYIRFHVNRFIKKCPCCQKMAQLKPIIHTLPFVTSNYEPMKVLNIDTIGPLSKTDDGFSHILVMIDCFTRFVDLVPIKGTTADESAKAIYNMLANMRRLQLYKLITDLSS
jgi:hypothetical protein